MSRELRLAAQGVATIETLGRPWRMSNSRHYPHKSSAEGRGKNGQSRANSGGSDDVAENASRGGMSMFGALYQGWQIAETMTTACPYCGKGLPVKALF
jgi:hypothetical protein